MISGDTSLIQGGAGMVDGKHSQSSGLEGEGGSMHLNAELVEPFSGVCTISEKGAVLIYLSKKVQASRRGDGLAMRLAEKFGITAKAVRDIWSLRSWAATTRPHWTPEDHDKFMKKKLCASCHSRGLTSFEHACIQCKARKPRGHPFFATPPASPAARGSFSRENSGGRGLSSDPASPALSRECSGLTPSPSSHCPAGGAVVEEHRAHPSEPCRSPSRRLSTSPTDRCCAASHQVDDVFVEDAVLESSDEGHQEQSACKNEGLEWLVSPDEIAQQFADILSSWEASKRV